MKTTAHLECFSKVFVIIDGSIVEKQIWNIEIKICKGTTILYNIEPAHPNWVDSNSVFENKKLAELFVKKQRIKELAEMLSEVYKEHEVVADKLERLRTEYHLLTQEDN